LPDFLWLGPYNTTEPYVTRDIAVASANGQKNMYVINAHVAERTQQFGVYVIDALTGAVVRNASDEPLKLKLPADEVMDQGDQRIWSAVATADNMLLVANTASEGKRFNVYAYGTPLDEPLLALSYPVPAGVNLGDYGKISVIGNFRDRTAKLYVTDNTFIGDDAAGTAQARIYVFSMKQEGECIFDNANPLPVTFAAGQSTTGNRSYFQNLCVSALKDGSFFWDDTFFLLRQVDLQGNVKSEIDAAKVPERANGGRYIGVDAQGKAYIAYFEYRSGKSEIYRYPQSGLSAGDHDVIANTNSLANKMYWFWIDANNYFYQTPQSIEASGGIVVDIEQDGKPVIYLMAQNRGIGAYRLKDVSIVAGGSSIPQVDASNKQTLVSQWGNVLKVSGAEIQSIELYSIAGQRIAISRGTTEISVAGLQGVLLVKVKTTAGKTEVHKLIIK
jgi:hypothetical protein